MHRAALHNHIAAPHRRARPIVKHKIDLALENHAVIHAERAVHDVDALGGPIGDGREVDDATRHAGVADQVLQFAVGVGPGALRGGRVGVGAEDGGEAGDEAGGANSVRWASVGDGGGLRQRKPGVMSCLPSFGHGPTFRVHRVCGSQDLILSEDRFAVCSVVGHNPSYSGKTCHGGFSGAPVDLVLIAWS